jgi:hypothetical protein
LSSFFSGSSAVLLFSQIDRKHTHKTLVLYDKSDHHVVWKLLNKLPESSWKTWKRFARGLRGEGGRGRRRSSSCE